MGTWTAPALLDGLKAKLDLRPGLTGVIIATGPLGDETPPEAIVLFGIRGAQEWAALGKKAKDDLYAVPGAIWIVKPGAGEAVIKEARDRATALLAELETELRVDPSVSGVVMVCAVGANLDLEQGTNANGRWVQLNFELEVRARI